MNYEWICLTNFSHLTLCKWRYKWLVVFETKIDAVGDKWEWLTEWFWKSTDISNSGMIIWSCKVYSLHKGHCLLIVEEDILCSINCSWSFKTKFVGFLKLNRNLNSLLTGNQYVHTSLLLWLVYKFGQKYNYRIEVCSPYVVITSCILGINETRTFGFCSKSQKTSFTIIQFI